MERTNKNQKTRVLDLKTRVEPETRVLKKVGFSSITTHIPQIIRLLKFLDF